MGQPYAAIYTLASSVDPYRQFIPPPPGALHPPVSSPGGGYLPAVSSSGGYLPPTSSSPGGGYLPPISSAGGGGGGYLPQPANNSSLSDRLRVGFGEKSPNLPRAPLIQVIEKVLYTE
jgi:hypothetical protein